MINVPTVPYVSNYITDLATVEAQRAAPPAYRNRKSGTDDTDSTVFLTVFSVSSVPNIYVCILTTPFEAQHATPLQYISRKNVLSQ